MKNEHLGLFFFALIALVIAQEYRTSPDKWKEPRNFHVPLLKSISERIIIKKRKAFASDSVIKSLNNAYCFSINQKDDSKEKTLEIMIFNERDSVIYILLKSIKSVDTVEWINEKLIFIRAWFGRIAAADLIFDVEAEEFIYKETCYDGHQAYKQAKESSSTK